MAQAINYVAAPTLAQFHGSQAMVRGVMGPIGSGKSVSCCIEVLTRSQMQAPNRKGVRKTRWAIIRNSYPELKSTTIQTWTDWIPETICPIVYDSPIRAKMVQKLPDGTTMDMEIYFLALDKPKDIKKLLSLELTGVWINEAREMSKLIVTAALSRTGRYPSKADCPAGLTWTGLIMDTNPPDDDHWWYKLAEEGDSDLLKSIMEGMPDDGRDYSWKFFKQPGALIPEYNVEGRLTGYQANPKAENVQHQQLGYQYWFRMTIGTDPEWVKVHCCGMYGSVFDGKPVYQGLYNDLVHKSPRPLGVFRGMPLQLGWDFGLTPSCIIGQLTPTGQLRILRELVCTRGGIKQFTENEVKPMLAQLFAGMGISPSTGDPAGNQASQADELTCLKQLGMMGIPTQAASTNDFIPRRQAVINRLTRTIDGQPGLLIDPSCKMITKGFVGGYKFERVQVSAEDERFKDTPAKNKFSHPHDALQYLVLGCDTVQVFSTVTPPPPVTNGWGGYI